MPKQCSASIYAAGAIHAWQSDIPSNISLAFSNTTPLISVITLSRLFSEPIAFPSATASRLTVKNGSTTISVSGATVDAANNTVTPTLGSSITSANLSNSNYTDASTKNDATGVTEDLAGNDLASTTASTITLHLQSATAGMNTGVSNGDTGVQLTTAASAAAPSNRLRISALAAAGAAG